MDGPAKPGQSEAIVELTRAVGKASHYLPAQAPLEVFVHHNTLHAFERLPFHDAVETAGKTLGAEGYLREDQYRAAYRSGRITEGDVDAALANVALGPLPPAFPAALALAKLMLLHDIGPETPAGLTWRLSEHAAAARFAPHGVGGRARADQGRDRAMASKRNELENAGSDDGAPRRAVRCGVAS